MVPHICEKCGQEFTADGEDAHNVTACPNCLQNRESSHARSGITATAPPPRTGSQGETDPGPTDLPEITLHPLSRWRMMLGTWAFVTLALVAVAWTYAGQRETEERLFRVMTFVGLALTARLFWKLWQYRPAHEWAGVALAIPGLIIAWVTCAVVASYFPQSQIFFDNASVRDLEVFCDGRPWVLCPADSNLQATLRPGKYDLIVKDVATGEQVDQRAVAITDRPSIFIFNLLGKQAYRRSLVRYSTFAVDINPEPPKVEVIRDVWFEPKVDHVFERPPLRISSDTSHGTRSFLLRGEQDEQDEKR